VKYVEEIPEEWKAEADFWTSHHYLFSPLFSEEECDKIIAIGERLEKENATITHKNSSYENTRNSQVSWMPLARETKWIYEWIWASVENTNHWKLDIRGFYETLQYTVYDSTDGVTKYDWHTDTGPGNNHRKISLSIQLSNSDEYSGGEFELERGGILNTPNYLKKGHTIMFPSLLRHRVLPITSGIRKSLVVWVAGPHIK
jgi:PKHD-type hydroxylase|tara:strand:+ start:2415 stop:3017 length:603 start_codon:yes stop_codon:yes gene_type:complete